MPTLKQTVKARIIRHLLPAKFAGREKLLAAVVVAMATASAALTWSVGMGAGAAWVLATILGTALIMAIAGADRCFFTALFTSLLSGGLFLAMMVYAVVAHDVRLNWGEFLTMLLMFCMSVILPTGFACLVTIGIKKFERSVSSNSGPAATHETPVARRLSFTSLLGVLKGRWLILCLLLSAYGAGYAWARSHKILIHRVSYATEGPATRYVHSISAGDFGPGLVQGPVTPVVVASCYWAFTPLRWLESFVCSFVPNDKRGT